MTVNDMYLLVQYAFNKSQNGVLTSDEFNRIANLAQNSYVSFLLGSLQQYQAGRPIARVELGQNSVVRQRLTPVIYGYTLNVDSTGFSPYPTDYVQTDSMWSIYGYSRIRFADQDKWFSTYNSVIDPVANNPIYKLRDTGFAAGCGERGLADGLAGFDPRGVGEGAGRIEIQDEMIAFDEIAGPVAHDEGAPRRDGGRRQRRGAGEGADEGAGGEGRRGEQHARVAVERGLDEGGVTAVGIRDGEGALAVLPDRGEGHAGILALGAVLLVAGGVFGKAEFGAFGREGERGGEVREGIAQGGALVVGAGDQIEPRAGGAVAELHGAFVKAVGDDGTLAVNGFPRGVFAALPRADELEAPEEVLGFVGGFEAEAGVEDDGLAVMGDAVARGAGGVEGHGEGDLATGRGRRPIGAERRDGEPRRENAKQGFHESKFGARCGGVASAKAGMRAASEQVRRGSSATVQGWFTSISFP